MNNRRSQRPRASTRAEQVQSAHCATRTTVEPAAGGGDPPSHCDISDCPGNGFGLGAVGLPTADAAAAARSTAEAAC